MISFLHILDAGCLFCFQCSIRGVDCVFCKETPRLSTARVAMNLRDLIRKKRKIEDNSTPEVSEQPDVVPGAVPNLGIETDDVLMKEEGEPVTKKNVDNETVNEDIQNMDMGKETAV